MTVKADVLLVAQIYGATSDITVGKRLNNAGKVDVGKHTGLVVAPEVLELAQCVNRKDIDLADSTEPTARNVAMAVSASIDPSGNSWGIEPALDTGASMHIWDPRAGWIMQAAGEFAFAYRLVRKTGGLTNPHTYTLTVGTAQAKADFLLVVQTPKN